MEQARRAIASRFTGRARTMADTSGMASMAESRKRHGPYVAAHRGRERCRAPRNRAVRLRSHSAHQRPASGRGARAASGAAGHSILQQHPAAPVHRAAAACPLSRILVHMLPPTLAIYSTAQLPPAP